MMKHLAHLIDPRVAVIFLLLASFALPLGAQNTAEVWPGDANTNGTVSHVDLLYLGRWFGETGPARDSISINWTLHEVQKWLPPQPGRPDPAHADCNGDSTVDILDLAAIETNYGFDNQSNLPDLSSLGSSSSGAAPLTISLAGGPLTAGTTDTLWIMLGDSANPVDSLLGFAATLTFDAALVDTAYAIFEGSWLGDPTQDLLTIDRYRSGELDLAATRTDRTDRVNGNGRVGGVVIVMTENLKKAVEISSLELDFSQALALTKGLQAAPLAVVTSGLPVYQATEPFEALVYPVPAIDQVNVVVLEPRTSEVTGRLLDMQGRLCRSLRFADAISISREGLRSGVYLLELNSGERVLRKRIVFLE